MKMQLKMWFISMLMCLIPVFTMASVWHVPGDYPTIQQGITAAVNGDTVMVADGTYTGSGNHNITLMGKGITVISENGPSSCIIDCENSYQGFVLDSQEDENCILSGFTIIRGVGNAGAGIYSNGSPQILNCVIRDCVSDDLGGGVAFVGEQTSPLIADCIIHDNSSLYGGGIGVMSSSESPTYAAHPRMSKPSLKPGTTDQQRSSGPNVTMNNVKVFGNQALAGGGISLEYSTLYLNSSTVASNSADNAGGGISLFSNSEGVVDSSFIIGNEADQGGGGIDINYCHPITIGNSVIGGNSAGAAGAGIYINSSTITTLYSNAIISNNGLSGDGLYIFCNSFDGYNNLIAFNDGFGISDTSSSENATYRNNLFYQNTSCDFNSYQYGCLNGSNSINQHIENAFNNIDGDPLLDISTTGFWTIAPSYDSQGNVSTFTDSGAVFTVGEFAGGFIQPDTNSTDYAFIIDNSETEIYVSGDIALDCHNGDIYKIHNFHLQNLSAALDRGDPAYSLAVDFEGDPRPGSDDMADIGPDEAPSEYVPLPDTVPPESSILELPALITQSYVDIGFYASDSASGVDYIELYYSFNGGVWTQYPGEYSESPIMFLVESAQGMGHYDFYAIATDRSGNVEDPPAGPDASTVIIDQFSGSIVFVDIDATGTGMGTDWENAIHSIESAIQIAGYFSVPTVWVAEGTYLESVTMQDELSVYGGFAGFEDSLDQRDYAAHPVIIDASTADNGQPADHVLMFSSCSFAWFDGVTLTGGLADGTGSDAFGGGVYLSYNEKDCVLANCIITGNRAANGGGISAHYSNNSIFNCRIIGNTATSNGGGVYVTPYTSDNQDDPPDNNNSPFLTKCIISDNHASNGGGIYVYYYSVPIIEQTIIAGNTAEDNGGGMNTSYYEYSSQFKKSEARSKDSRASGTWMMNSIIIGNDARIGGALYDNAGSPSLLSSDICYNSAEIQAGGCFGTGGTDWVIKNCILYGNNNHAICDDDLDDTARLEYCLFENNPDGDYFIVFQERTYTGAHQINLNVNEAENNIEGDPLFTLETTGVWSESPEYLAEENRTILTDDTAAFEPNGLAGKLLNPDSSQTRHTIILGNTETTIVVFGDYTDIVQSGDAYNMFDVHLQNGSAALDRADLDGDVVVDFENDPRPGPDGLMDMGMDEASADFGPAADNTKPQSFVCDTLEMAVSGNISIEYKASDAESGISYVELFYRFEEGAWILFPGQYSQSPIPFYASEGNGTYDFYTVATDLSGNQEDPPGVPDTRIQIITEFPGNRIYINQNMSNPGIGDSWDTALRTVTAAELISSYFDISEIWIAEGTYSVSMILEKDIQLYGGFSGSEDSPEDRDIESHPTILDASEADEGNPAQHVISSINYEDFSVEIDGFILQGSSSTGIYFMEAYLDCSILNCTIREISGEDVGGIYGQYGMLYVHNCLFENNQGYYSGGIVWRYSEAPMIVSNTVFRNNAGTYGDAVYMSGNDLNLVNCLFDSNGGSNSESTVCCYEPTNIVNCTLVNNSSYFGALIAGYDTFVVNSIFWGNVPTQIYVDYYDPVVSYSCIQDGFWGLGNISDDPLFNSGPEGEFYLSQTAAGQTFQSPCVNAGVAPASEICYPIPGGTQCISELTTRTDLWNDIDIVDMGFHYNNAQISPPTPTPETYPTYTPYPTHTPYPTYTPVPTYTPFPTCTPPQKTVTPSPQPSQTPNISVSVTMPCNYLTPGSNCFCKATVHNNTGHSVTDCPLFVILWIENMVFFAPSWTSVDNYLVTHPEFPPGDTSIDVINPFAWPENAGACDEAVFFGAVTDPEVTRIMGDFGKFEFGWGL